MMTVGSLFSGIGGMELGLERTGGFQVRWQVEIDDWCRRVLTKHWPDVPKYGDIRAIEDGQLEPVDLICGGFPCQPVSQVGLRNVQQDARWLWPEFHRIVRLVRPKYVLVENVTGLLSAGFDDVLGGLAESGYDAEWRVFSAAEMGGPHTRGRVFLLAHRRWEPVRLAAELPACGCCGEPWCDRCRDHYSDCCCPGPMSSEDDGWRVEVEPWGMAAYPCGVGFQGWVYQGERLGVQALPETEVWRYLPAPFVCRGSDGIPGRVDRLRGLGNAVVPQVVEHIGHMILAREGA